MAHVGELPEGIDTMPNTSFDLHDLEIRADRANFVTWEGREALRLENGLALVDGPGLTDARVEVLVGTEGPAYPGVAFRVADVLNHELAYAVPHVSGQWDTLQYDPVFHGSNTWQLYHGPGYQREAHVPTGRWFRLELDFCGDRAAIAVDGQPPLTVSQLARSTPTGAIGLWTFRPAYFSDLHVAVYQGEPVPSAEPSCPPPGCVETWFLEGFGVVACEPSGVLNLNRYLPLSAKEARLLRRFETSKAQEVALEFGFSDQLSLELDGSVVYRGENTFRGFEDRAARGYADLSTGSHRETVPAGKHTLAAYLEVSEGFGWGMVLAARGEGLHWLPPEPG